MEKIILFNPAISSLNLGDHIIAYACKENIESLLKNKMCIDISTHLPISNLYMGLIKNVKYSFVLGSNLLMNNMNGRFRQWDIKLWNTRRINKAILMGVGWHQYSSKTNSYTKKLYNRVLSNEYYHSVRDEYTKIKLNDIGIKNVINTGCPTLWNLDKKHCMQIPKNKSYRVIFTLTDYKKDLVKDKKMINILKNNYEKLYFWIQGGNDYEYLKELYNGSDIEIINPNLEDYNKIIKNGNIDFVGTRLHGGIRALQNKCRTIIISVDNRAKELNRNYNIPIIEREKIDILEEKINKEWETDIHIPIDRIKKWKSQFMV